MEERSVQSLGVLGSELRVVRGGSTAAATAKIHFKNVYFSYLWPFSYFYFTLFWFLLLCVDTCADMETNEAAVSQI